MQSSCATSHKLHIAVVRFKTKLELSKNFNFPKNKFHDCSTIISVLYNLRFSLLLTKTTLLMPS